MNSRWAILGLIFGARLTMGMQFQSLASVALLIVSDLRIGYGQIGWLMGLYMLPGVVIAYPGGALGRRFGERRLVLVGLALMAVGGVATAASHHFPLAAAGRVVSGAGGVLLNGHMHSTDLEGNRIQVGTFTGGGPFSHFLTAGDGEELVGQPSSFDVLTFGTDCRLSSLTRYRFRDVIEGRPAYDDVSIINGNRIDTREADPRRTCEKPADTGVEPSIEDVPSAPSAATSP